jgi:hypothetical protein
MMMVMDKKKAISIAIGMTGIITVIFVYFVWQNALKNNRNAPLAMQSNSPAAEMTQNPQENIPAGTNNIYSNSSPTTNTPFEQFKEIVKPFTNPFMSVSPNSEVVTPTPTVQLKKEMTKQEIFDWTWAPEYRKQLVKIQEVMIQDGFMPESKKDVNLNSDESIYAVIDWLFQYALNKGLVVQEDYAKLQEGLRGLPERIAYDRRVLLESDPSPIVLPGRQTFNPNRTEKNLFSDIIDGFKFAFSVPEANAQLGVWVTVPDCYKASFSDPGPPGVNLWAPCCNCGCRYVGVACIPVPDCGFNSIACDIPFGCLNLMCGWASNAIWDSFTYPGTGICGCG